MVVRLYRADHRPVRHPEDVGALRRNSLGGGVHEDGPGQKSAQQQAARVETAPIYSVEGESEHACILVGHALRQIGGKTRL